MKRFTLFAIAASAMAFGLIISLWPEDAAAQETSRAAADAIIQKWEYRVIRIEDRRPEEAGRNAPSRSGGAEAELNRLGEEGWELVTIRIDAAATRRAPIFYLKRPKN